MTVDEPRHEATPKPGTREGAPDQGVREAKLDPDVREALTGVFGAPAFILPWIDRLLEPDELLLVAALATAGMLTVPAAVAALGRPVSLEFFERAVRRGIIDRPTPEVVVLSDFASRLEIWTLFEGWKDLPDDVRRALADWQLARYIDDKRSQVEDLLAGEQPQPGLENAEYLLLAEAEALIARAEHVYLWPCDCRAVMEGCRKPSLVCLRFDNQRGLGWEISHERAVAVLRDADRHGLMHTGEVGAAADQTPLTAGAICNCCADCCFPQLAGQALGATRLWPRARYVAARDAALCGGCGRCARRCPFGAFVVEPGGRGQKNAGRLPLGVAFDKELCRGCGLCATGCPDGAIAMAPLTDAAR
jgi:ferredoxin